MFPRRPNWSFAFLWQTFPLKIQSWIHSIPLRRLTHPLPSHHRWPRLPTPSCLWYHDAWLPVRPPRCTALRSYIVITVHEIWAWGWGHAHCRTDRCLADAWTPPAVSADKRWRRSSDRTGLAGSANGVFVRTDGATSRASPDRPPHLPAGRNKSDSSSLFSDDLWTCFMFIIPFCFFIFTIWNSSTD